MNRRQARYVIPQLDFEFYNEPTRYRGFTLHFFWGNLMLHWTPGRKTRFQRWTIFWFGVRDFLEHWRLYGD